MSYTETYSCNRQKTLLEFASEVPGNIASCVAAMGNREEESSLLEMWIIAFPGASPIDASCSVTRSSPANTLRSFAAAVGNGSKTMTQNCARGKHLRATSVNCSRPARTSTTVWQTSPERTCACPQRLERDA